MKQGEKEALFAVNFPVAESQTFGTEVIFTGEQVEPVGSNTAAGASNNNIAANTTTDNMAAGGKDTDGFTPNGGINLRMPLIILVLVLLALEWYITIKQGVLPRKDLFRRRVIQALQIGVVLL